MIQSNNICKCDICGAIYSIYKGKNTKSMCNNCLTVWRGYEANRTYLDTIMPHMNTCAECGEEFIYPIKCEGLYCKYCYKKKFKTETGYDIQDLYKQSQECYKLQHDDKMRGSALVKEIGFQSVKSEETRQKDIDKLMEKYSDVGMTREDAELIVSNLIPFNFRASSIFSLLAFRDSVMVAKRIKESGYVKPYNIGKYIDSVIDEWELIYLRESDERIQVTNSDFKKACLNLYMTVCMMCKPIKKEYIAKISGWPKEAEEIYKYAITRPDRFRISDRYKHRKWNKKKREKEANKNGL